MAQVYLVASPDIVLGVVGEWHWMRHPFAESAWLAVAQFLPAAVGMFLFYYVAWAGSERLFLYHAERVGDHRRQRRGPMTKTTAAFLLGLVAVSWLWMKTCERSTPALHRNLKSSWVLYDPSSSGYFFESVFHIESTSEFLTTYHSRMLEGDVLHVGTHPPGLFLLCRASLRLLEEVPPLTVPLGWTMLRDDVEAFRMLEGQAALARPLTQKEFDAMFLLSELTTLAAALSAIPVYYTIRCMFNAVTAWRVTCLWATFPCLVIFLPKSDVLFTITATASVCCGVQAIGLPVSTARRLALSLLSGLFLWCGLMLSLAHLPVLVLLVGLGVLRVVRVVLFHERLRTERQTALLSPIQGLTGIVLTVVICTVGFSLATNCNIFSVWQQNLVNHAAFYETSTRTYSKWLLVNPLELGVAVGLPFAVIVTFGFLGTFVRRFNRQNQFDSSIAFDFILAVAVTLGALWLSGRNSGEAARLWCFLTPWLLVVAARIVSLEHSDDGIQDSAIIWKSLLFLQLIVCAVTVGRVSGFQL